MRRVRIVSIVVAGVVTLAAATACGTSDPGAGDKTGPVADVTFEAGTTMDRLHRAGKIRIGTKFDQPGFGLKGLDGKPTGFDVEIGKIIATELGIPSSGIEWVESASKVREEHLETDKVDIVVATYTINSERLKRVDFAGPYYVAGQQIMTRKSDNSIIGPETFRAGAKKVCSSTGSTPAKNITTYLKDQATQLVLFDVYTKCADALKAGQVDAVTTDNVILTGFVAQHPDDFKIVGAKFTTEPYGIGVKKGDEKFRAFINDVLEKVAKDGRYAKAWTATAGKYDADIPEAPAVNRY
ncbi:glutamate ABC transporter substrate-binding protein [Dactylosporangium sp. NPDC005572]|uniref:glutamate ABC transporter substrate-binding protein n=1 Tax=Dactylosporangium sp. NPDC005572 TaxID=3156889 RepID=UPI0033B8B486